ncbi:hypothetical protein ACFW1M_41065 [Streptomyces inhibens]|uniref:hypothetical protein n=1 Tax=Streptomyces inhibens TaxID=2293571 RepID=UPI0036D1603B
MSYDDAVAKGCQAFADRQKKSDPGGPGGKRIERTMVSKGLAVFIDVPDDLVMCEIKPTPGDLDRVISEQVRHKVGRTGPTG